MSKKITIIDLANVSGVSKSTISRYLQGKTTNPKNVTKIEKAIHELNYVKNSFAQYLRSQEPNFIGVLIPDFDNPFFLKIINKLDKLSEDRGYSLIIKTTRSDVSLEKKALRFIQGFLTKKIIICRSELSEAFVSDLKLNYQIVSIDREYSGIHSVVSDNYQNGYLMASHLASLESGNLMFFARQRENASVLNRIQGFKDKMLELERKVYEYRYATKETLDVEHLKAYVKRNKICGIISRNDNDALKIMSHLNEFSKSQKATRIRIAGFDNIDLSRQIAPQLTTIDQRIELMCDLAFNCLLSDEIKVRNIIQSGELIQRESTILGIR